MDHLFNLTVKPVHNELEESYVAAMKRLNDFFDIGWTQHLPPVFIVEDRATIDCLRTKNTESWVVGWSEHRKVFLLAREKMGTESDRAHSVEEYNALLTHELCHLFFSASTNGGHTPIWLTEGLSGYVSGDIQFKKKPASFSSFLEFFDTGGAGVYKESGFAVEALVKAFGKEKILDLLRNIKKSGGNPTKDKFNALFKAVYGFEPTYDAFNNLIK
ncbi:MAG: hypothetical protein WC798_00295 [Candidatus Paceibacterota bacterium]|jgi:hypothetical protein